MRALCARFTPRVNPRITPPLDIRPLANYVYVMSKPIDADLLAPQLLDEIRACLMHVESDPFMGPRIFLENAGTRDGHS
jgi:hypothetical protein